MICIYQYTELITPNSCNESGSNYNTQILTANKFIPDLFNQGFQPNLQMTFHDPVTTCITTVLKDHYACVISGNEDLGRYMPYESFMVMKIMKGDLAEKYQILT